MNPSFGSPTLDTTTATPLAARRQAAAAERASDASWLGGLAYGVGAAAAPAYVPLAVVAAPPLEHGAAAADVWQAAPAVRTGRCGRVRWRDDGDWLWGALELDESAAGEPDGDLAAAARAAYRDVFATLAAAGGRHLLRVWNYLPHIHAEEQGLERYRAFNAGRQQAFLEAGAAAFDGAPAACALGLGDGPLCLRFLAGRAAARAVENPRQVSAYRYPSDYGPRSPSFSRAVLVDAGGGQIGFFISGTASIVGHASVHAGDVHAQTHEAIANLEAVAGQAQSLCTARFPLDRLSLVAYVRQPEEAGAVRAALAQRLGADSTALRQLVMLRADICRRELQVEIEGHAFTAGHIQG